MIFSIAMYMQGGTTINDLESMQVSKVHSLYSRCSKHSKEIERESK